MNQTYNSQYYIDIFKYLLQRKLKKGPQTNDSFINPEGIDISALISVKSPRRTQSSNNLKVSKENNFFQQKWQKKTENKLPEINESRRNKARLYNEGLRERVLEMRRKKQDDLQKKKEKLENRQNSKQKKFLESLKASKKMLETKIKEISRKREENMSRAIRNREKFEGFAMEKGVGMGQNLIRKM